MCLNYLHRYDEAITILREILRKEPADPLALSTLRTSYHLTGRYEEALDIWRHCFELNGDRLALAAPDSGYAESGYKWALQRVAESQIRQRKNRFISPWPIATLYTRAGMPEEALTWLKKALEAHDPNMPYLNCDPIFDYMRDNPRFRELIRKIGLDKT
jgi:adenylate cyclase